MITQISLPRFRCVTFFVNECLHPATDFLLDFSLIAALWLFTIFYFFIIVSLWFGGSNLVHICFSFFRIFIFSANSGMGPTAVCLARTVMACYGYGSKKKSGFLYISCFWPKRYACEIDKSPPLNVFPETEVKPLKHWKTMNICEQQFQNVSFQNH